MHGPQRPDALPKVLDSGLECLVALARFHNIAARVEQLHHEFADGAQAFSRDQLLLAVRKLGLLAKAVETRSDRLTQTPLPGIAEAIDGNVFILARVDQGQALIQISGAERPQTLSLEELVTHWNGKLILLRSQASIAGDLARFDFTWFIPALSKYHKLLGEVLLASFCLQIFALLTQLFFHARRVGDSVTRVRDLENIRSFLTNAITLLLDLLVCVVFIAVMLLYSGWLSLVVILSLPLYVLLSLFITPPLRARLQESFNRGAENQAFLVESLNGIDRLKALAVEPQSVRRWDNQLAAYISASFRTQVLSTLTNEGVGLIGTLFTVLTFWLGARLVMEGQLSVGQLIAFNMLAGRVPQSIMRLGTFRKNNAFH